MPRTKGGFKTRRQHKKIIKLAKSYRGTRNRLFKRAQEAVVRAGEHAFSGRKKRRRDLRRLWIMRLNAALGSHGIKYSRFVAAAKKANVTLNRKILSELAISNPKDFEKVVETVKSKL